MNSEYVAEYDRLEKDHWWWRARRQIVLSVLKKLCQRNGIHTSLLDVGCGAGVNLAALRGDFECVGVEPDPILAEKARDNSAVPIHCGSLPSGLPKLGRTFDYILLLDVLEHIEDDVAALKAVAELLAPQGRIVINVPALPWMWSVHDEINQHKRRYVAEGLEKLIKSAGLRVSFLTYWGAFPVPLAYLERRVRWSSKRKESYNVQVPSAPANRFLQKLLTAEYAMTRLFRLPFGLSLIAVAHKP